MKRKLPYFELIGLLLILALAAYLRLVQVGHNPGWYSDEGTFIDIAMNLGQGKFEYMAINQSTLIFAKLPLFPLLLAGLFEIWGAGIQVLRSFTGILGVLSVGLLYWIVHDVQEGRERILAFLSALMLAIYPQAILYNRLGFSYNLLAPLVLLTGWGLWKYLGSQRPTWLAMAVLAIGVGSVVDLMMLTLIIPLGLVVSSRRWKDLFWSLPLLVLPLGLYVAMMLIRSPEAFLFDLSFTLTRIGGVPWLAQLPLAIVNYTQLLSWDYWLVPAIIGLFMLRPIRWRRLCLLLFFLPLLALGRTVGLIGLGFYYLIPLLPFVALGMAALVRYGVPQVAQTVRYGLFSLVQNWGWNPSGPKGQWWQRRVVVFGTSLALFLLVITPFLLSTISMFFQVQSGFDTAIDTVLINPDDAYRAADFVNARSGPDHLVILSPAIGWLFQGHVADFQMAVAAEGKGTQHLPAKIPAHRFEFEARYTQATFVVIDNLWRSWAAPNIPEVAEMIEQVEQWPLVFKSGDVEVYRNPANER